MADTRPGMVRMSATLTVHMKATIGVMIAFVVFLVSPIAERLLSARSEVAAVLVSLPTFIALTVILLVFAWRGKRWAYVGVVVLGAFVAVASTPTPLTPQDPVPVLLLWETMLLTVFGLLMALEGCKAYSELRQAKS